MDIKTNFEFPRGDDNTKYQQRIAQDLSKNFRAIVNNILKINTSISQADASHIDFTFTLSNAQAVTVNHGFGTIPTGWYVIDLIDGYSGAVGGILARTAWTTSTISFTGNNAIATVYATVTYKVRVFK